MISNISKYRSQLMGLMILWIMLYHVKMSYCPPLLVNPKIIGYGGVDGFLFLAGMGSFCSYSRDRNPLNFYQRRLKRLLPAFYPILCLWILKILFFVRPENPLGVIVGSITGLSFWHGLSPRFNWYIEAIWLFYGLVPFFVFLLNQEKKRYLWAMAAFLVLINTVFFGSFTLVAVSRFPIFLLGLWTGKLLLEKKELSRKTELLSYLVSILGFALMFLIIRKFHDTLWKYGTWWYPFLLIIPGLLAFCSRILSLLDRTKLLSWINLILGQFGACSFELYLVHVFVFEELGRNSVKVLLACIAAAFVYHLLVRKATALWAARRRPQALQS